ncbi:hypothetical protein [Thiolapillus brandeum]|uniref:Uncharacterized protein n=1 Tax=Thiolapillus brandeum TaxID=1076588 RepID=A0A7U6GHQ6_9GAMM|nr:hypothetical protein [Thiolapillus brandeum]BAO43879.1 hypothetical protein TBH_C0949 [Thiolapillus brandeum]
MAATAKRLEVEQANTPKPPKEEEILDLGGEIARQVNERVEELTVRLKKIVTTDEGKLQIIMETEGIADDEALADVKSMLVLQQCGVVNVSMKPLQRDLFDG